jgi:hypothetical protein
MTPITNIEPPNEQEIAFFARIRAAKDLHIFNRFGPIIADNAFIAPEVEFSGVGSRNVRGEDGTEAVEIKFYRPKAGNGMPILRLDRFLCLAVRHWEEFGLQCDKAFHLDGIFHRPGAGFSLADGRISVQKIRYPKPLEQRKYEWLPPIRMEQVRIGPLYVGPFDWNPIVYEERYEEVPRWPAIKSDSMDTLAWVFGCEGVHEYQYGQHQGSKMRSSWHTAHTPQFGLRREDPNVPRFRSQYSMMPPIEDRPLIEAVDKERGEQLKRATAQAEERREERQKEKERLRRLR